MKIWKISIFIALLSACQTETKQLLTDEKMVEVLTDLNAAEAVLESEKVAVKDSMSKIYYAQIFDKHQVTRRDFDSTMAILSKNPVALDSIYNRVLRKLERKTEDSSSVKK